MKNRKSHEFNVNVREEISAGIAVVHCEVRGVLNEEMFDSLVSAIEKIARSFEKGE